MNTKNSSPRSATVQAGLWPVAGLAAVCWCVAVPVYAQDGSWRPTESPFAVELQQLALLEIPGLTDPAPIALPSSTPASVALPDAPAPAAEPTHPSLIGTLFAPGHSWSSPTQSASPKNSPLFEPIQREQPGAISLTIDQAIATGVKNNLQVRLSSQQERAVHGEIFVVGNALVPNLRATVDSEAEEINLAAMGFKQSTLAKIKIPGVNLSGFATIVKVNTTSAQLSLSQALFNVPAFFLFRAAQRAQEASHWTTLDAQGGVAQGVGGLYLKTLADQTQVSDASALLKQDQISLDHATAARDAGVGINLDVLRAQVDLQNEQQRLLQARNAVAKDKVALNRAMGQPAGQELNLVDTVPFADLEERTLDEQLAIAYLNRQDLHSLESQLAVAQEAERAVKYQYLPTLSTNGYYGVIGVTNGSYHGNFLAEFKLTVPIFEEATLRGQREVGHAQLVALEHQIKARKTQIEAQIRSSRLDLESSRQLVTVARSNVILAQQALDDASLRFSSGVADNLAVAQAQAALVGAQTQVIQTEFQYNYAKLTLARQLGVVQTEYNHYLGR
jgi:outer membrane protein TolC